MGLEWRALAVVALLTLGGPALAQRPAGAEPGTLEFAVGGIAGAGLFGEGKLTPQLGLHDPGAVFETGLQLRVDRILGRRDAEGLTVGLSTGGLALVGALPAGISVAEWRPLTLHLHVRIGFDGRLFFGFPIGVSIFSTRVDYPRPVVLSGGAAPMTDAAKYTTAASYTQVRFGMGGGWRWENVEAFAGINVCLGNYVMNVAFTVTVAYVFAPPWEWQKARADDSSGAMTQTETAAPAPAPVPAAEAPASSWSVVPLSDAPAEAVPSAAAPGLAGEFSALAQTPGRPQSLSLCPDGRYFEGGSKVGSWSGPAQGDQGTLEVRPDRASPFKLTYRILREKRFCSPAGCDLELDGLRYGLDPTMGNCLAP